MDFFSPSVLKDESIAPRVTFWVFIFYFFAQITFLLTSLTPSLALSLVHVCLVLPAQPAFQTASHCSQRETDTHIATLKYVFV